MYSVWSGSVALEPPPLTAYPFMQQLAQQFEDLKRFNCEIFPNHLLDLEEARARVCVRVCACVRARVCVRARGVHVCTRSPTLLGKGVFFGDDTE